MRLLARLAAATTHRRSKSTAGSPADSIYGPKTAGAVKALKNAPNRKILGPGIGLEHASLKTNIALPDNPANDMEVFVIEIRK